MAGGKTQFDSYALIPLKNMVKHSSPERIHEVSQHWINVHEELQQAAADLQAAIQHATAHWEGDAATNFAKAGGDIQTSLTNTAAHAQNTSSAMKLAGDALKQTQANMAKIKVPSTLDSGLKDLGDGLSHDDTQFKADLKTMNRIDAVNKNYDSLSAMEISHQYAIGMMEYLGPEYQRASGYLGDGGRISDPRTGFPTPPPTNPVPPGTAPSPMPMPTNPGGQPPSSGSPTHHDHGIPGIPQPQSPSQQQPTTHSDLAPRPPVGGPAPGTGLDSWTPPTTSPIQGGGGGLGTVGGGGGLGGIGGGGVGGGGAGGGFVGGGFVAGGLGGAGLAGGGSAGRAGGAAGAGGMHAPGGLGGAGKGGAAGGKGSGLVRKGGGAIGGAKSGKASGRGFTEGGSGIGKNGKAGANGGFHGGQGAANKKKGKDGNRPDYLVEDEDTWRGGEALPPVIE